MLNKLTVVQKWEKEQDKQYGLFIEGVKEHFDNVVKSGKKLFTVNVDNLFDIYLSHIPEEVRNLYRCNCCRQFIVRFGNLVIINEDGTLTSALWGNAPELFSEVDNALKEVVENAKVTGIYFSDTKKLGTAKTGEWMHLHAELPSHLVNTSRLNTASQRIAEKLEDYRTITRFLLHYDLLLMNKVVALLGTDTIYRGDRVSGNARWVRDLQSKRFGCDNSRLRDNITWLVVSNAPSGYVHIKSSVLGSLFEDLDEGYVFEEAVTRFAYKMNPATFRRSQSAPTENAKREAEKVVAKLGIEKSLGRRYAKFDEIEVFLWKERQAKAKIEAPKTGGVFGNVATKGSTLPNMAFEENLPLKVMTWDKFVKTVLPMAESIEAKVDDTSRLMAMVTAMDSEAPNILNWDNTFSWYYHGGVDGEIKARVENAGGRYENNEIRCSLIWDNYTDLDIHCITPRNNHINFSERVYDGGKLDTDANGMDKSTNTPVENIRFAEYAQNGIYKFYVHNYSDKNHKDNPFKAELDVNGAIYTFEGRADRTNNRVTVFEFDYIKGQPPFFINSVPTAVGSNGDAWGVQANSFVKVKGITISPNIWGNKSAPQVGTHVFFLLDGCKDESEGRGRGFFNEMLTPELHSIRKTLEGFTAVTPIDGVEDADACGLGYIKDREWNLILKVKTADGTRMIKVDRWD